MVLVVLSDTNFVWLQRVDVRAAHRLSDRLGARGFRLTGAIIEVANLLLLMLMLLTGRADVSHGLAPELKDGRGGLDLVNHLTCHIDPDVVSYLLDLRVTYGRIGPIIHCRVTPCSVNVVELLRLVLDPALELVDRDHLRVELKLHIRVVSLLGQLQLEHFNLVGAIHLLLIIIFIVHHAIKVTIIGMQQLLLKRFKSLRLAKLAISFGNHPCRLFRKINQLMVLQGTGARRTNFISQSLLLDASIFIVKVVLYV